MAKPHDVDRDRLRRDRLARALDAMERHGLDALVLGREGNARYVGDAQRLWLAGPRPFGPGCVVVRATRDVHLLATSDEGVPATIPRSRLYALTWNPETLAARLARIPGLADAATIGVDGWSPSAGRLLARVAPNARLADGDAALREARSVKTLDEVAMIRAAAEVARHGLAAVRRTLASHPDATEPALRAAFVHEIASRGVTVPAHDVVVHPAVRGPLVALRCGVVLDGYEATLIRTVARDRSAERAGRAAGRRGDVAEPLRSTPRSATTAEVRDAIARCAEVRDRLLAACHAGASARDLLAAYDDAGARARAMVASLVALPAFPVVQGVGLGAEPPFIGPDHACDPAWRVERGMVLALHAHAAAGGASCSSQDVVHVGPDGAEVLTRGPDE